jgi:hypothetical protein
MTTYLIIPDPVGNGYNVQLVAADGVHQTVLHFATETEAEEWVASNRQRDKVSGEAKS